MVTTPIPTLACLAQAVIESIAQAAQQELLRIQLKLAHQALVQEMKQVTLQLTRRLIWQVKAQPHLGLTRWEASRGQAI